MIQTREDKIRTRLERVMDELSLSASRWSSQSGLSANTLKKFMNAVGDERTLTDRTLGKLAVGIDVTQSALMGYINSDEDISFAEYRIDFEKRGQEHIANGNVTQLPEQVVDGGSPFVPLSRIPVIGEVQAGEWSEANQFEGDDLEYMALEQHITERWGDRDVSALRVVGDSMDLVFPEGGCVCFMSPYDITIEDEDYVVVQRIRGGEYEATVKQIQIDKNSGVAYLVPKSSNPKWKPIQMPWPYMGGSLPVSGQEIERVEIIGKVVTYLHQAMMLI